LRTFRVPKQEKSERGSGVQKRTIKLRTMF
jgi:hypothetical protein